MRCSLCRRRDKMSIDLRPSQDRLFFVEAPIRADSLFHRPISQILKIGRLSPTLDQAAHTKKHDEYDH